jgi:hypothetical protein
MEGGFMPGLITGISGREKPQEPERKRITFGGCGSAGSGYNPHDFDQAFLGGLPDRPYLFG